MVRLFSPDQIAIRNKDGAKQFGVKPWLLYDYNRKGNHDAREPSAPARAEPAQGEDSKEAAAIPVALPGDVGELIRAYRRDHPGHGFKRIQDLLKQKHLVIVTRKQIRRVLKEAGLLETCDSSFDREEASAKGTRRFEAGYPGEIWQMDVTYVYICRIPVSTWW